MLYGVRVASVGTVTLTLTPKSGNFKHVSKSTKYINFYDQGGNTSFFNLSTCTLPNKYPNCKIKAPT